MLDVALPIALVLALVGCWGGGLVALDVFTTDDVRAWHRLAALRGYSSMRTRFERAAARSHLLRRLQRELDLEHLLAVSQRDETAAVFMLRAGGVALAAFATLLIVDSVGRVTSGAWPLNPWIVLLLSASLLPLAVLELRRQAHASQRAMGRALADMTMMLAIMTDVRGFQLADAVGLLSRAADDSRLSRLVHGGYRRLVTGHRRSTVDLYKAIAQAYDLPQLRMLADAASAANAGLAEREVYTHAAIAMYQQRLALARESAARARILVTLPVAGMLIPLLLLIGAPTLSAISNGL